MYKKLDVYDSDDKITENYSNSVTLRQPNMSPDDNTNLISSDQEDDDINISKSHLTFIEIIILNMTYMGLSMMFLLLSVVVVPAQIEIIVGSEYKGIVLGITIGIGAVFTFIVGPLVGMKSDRLVNKYGRRRPIIVISVIMLCVSCIVIVAIAPAINSPSSTNNSTNNDTRCEKPDLVARRCAISKFYQNDNKPVPMNKTYINRLWMYIPLYLVVIISYVSTITPYNGLIADKSHPDQRGLSSGAMGGMILLGNIFGAALGLLITPLGVLPTVCVGMAILLICVTITVSFTSEHVYVLNDSPLSCREKVRKFWLPLKDHDFRWLFITRFLMQQGLTSVIGFLEYWIKDMIELPPCWNAYKAVSYLLLPMLICAATSSVLSGIISDKFGKRKIILMINSFIMAIAVILMSSLKGPNAYYIAIFLALIFGVALGGYQSVDFALLMDIIPDERDQSLMIAVWHQAMILPQALAVPISGVIVDLFEKVNCHIGLGYIILLLIIAIYFFLSGCFIRKIQTPV